MDTLPEVLGVLLGALLAALTVVASVALPPRVATVAALLGGVILLGLAGSVLLASDSMSRSFGAVYLGLGAACALGLAVPRWLRWRGLERHWVPPGAGIATLLTLIALGMGADALGSLLLTTTTKAVVSSGMVNGLVLGTLGAVVVTSVLAWRGVWRPKAGVARRS